MAFFEAAAFSFTEIAVVIVILVLFSVFSFLKKSIANSGIVFGNIVGTLVFLLGGLTGFLVLAVFFLTAEFSTIYSRKKIGKKHEQRNTSNIVGNSGAAILALVFGQSIGFFGAIAAALSDTVSSELGMLSKKKPKLITSFEEVPMGTDGGITPTGLLMGVFGSALIAGIYFFINHSAALFAVILVSGFAGSLADSFLGAVFERKGRLNNTQVNFLASLFGAATAIFLSAML